LLFGSQGVEQMDIGSCGSRFGSIVNPWRWSERSGWSWGCDGLVDLDWRRLGFCRNGVGILDFCTKLALPSKRVFEAISGLSVRVKL